MARSLIEDTFLASSNGLFIEQLYARYLENPDRVDESWRAFFDEVSEEAPALLAELRGASWAPRSGRVIGNGAVPRAVNGAAAPEEQQATRDSIRALMLIRAYRMNGHFLATLDPLGLEEVPMHPELDPAEYGFEEQDYDRPIFIDGVLGRDHATLREIVAIVRDTYCGSIGVEFAHIQDQAQKSWIQERIEGIRNQTQFTKEGKKAMLERLVEAETFERFLNVKYPGTKRFGLDGGEALLPALEQILKRGSMLGVEEVVIGMPHRGRLNVLAHVMHKPHAAIFSEFQGQPSTPEEVQGSGDVKYHLGASGDRVFDDKTVHLSLTANPSHLEAVNPVVVGKVRAKQRQLGDKERRRVMGILMHGDAAFAGQGLVAETFGLSDIKGYRSGGTIHFIVNNQIGFTTSPKQTRASRYPTDVANIVQAPIFHVNGDDVEAVVHAARIAIEFRQEFRRDVVIDMWCYRRFGHNEADEPGFTQPQMYRAIKGQPRTCEVYSKQLVENGDLSAEEATAAEDAARQKLEQTFEAAASYKPNKADWLEGQWSTLTVAPSLEERRGKTDVSLKSLREVGDAITRVPDGFDLHPKLRRLLDGRAKMIKSGKGVDWPMAEALAFGTLAVEGTLVRLSGQDSSRGTFSQRHAALIDQTTEERYIPLAQIREGQARFVVLDSLLSEAGVLGFEYGYTLAEPNALIMWEAQFGDFANGAQVIIDQFIASGESKWLRMSGLVLLLPHGHEGQGPEHSSARLERYLQLCAEDNMQVVNATTPAQYFHVLRRQIHRKFRKPLILMTPKSLLRHKGCVSELKEMGPGTCFHRVLSDPAKLKPNGKIRRVVLCSGKVYYDLLAERDKRGIDDIALVRVEQLYPFPSISLADELKKYPKADIVWCQEEPRNMGAWSFIDRRIEELLESLDIAAERPLYAGRRAAASPATGLMSRHLQEQEKLVDEALTIG